MAVDRLFVVIPVFNGWAQTRYCLDALADSSDRRFQTIVVDHGSTDDTKRMLPAFFPEVIHLLGPNTLWWAGAVNLGIREALSRGATHVMLLNNDSYVAPHTVATLRRHAAAQPNAIVAAVQERNGRRQSPLATHCFLLGFPTIVLPRFLAPRGELVPTPLILGARGVIIRREVFDRVGMFDETALPHYGADHDFYLRCRKAGISLLVAQSALVYIDDTRTTLAHAYARMSIGQFIASLRERRSHKNLRDLAALFRRHYPIPGLHHLGVALNLARYAALFCLQKLLALGSGQAFRKKAARRSAG